MRLRDRWREFLERRSAVLGINRRNVDFVYRRNPRRHFPLADDKLRTKTVLEAANVPVPRTHATIKGLFAIPEALEVASMYDDFVVKPSSGSGGDGIVVVTNRVDGGWQRAGGREFTPQDLAKHLADIVFGAYSKGLDDSAFLEERVCPDPEMAVLCTEGLADIRLIVVDGNPRCAMVRVPTRRSAGRANLHQGGVGLAVELDNGVVRRGQLCGRSIDCHPDSGERLIGLTIPRWQEVLDVGTAAAAAVPLGFLGVDLVVDETRGAVVLELNVRPGLEIQNVHGQGLRPLFAGPQHGR